jgi:hypothetical protein
VCVGIERCGERFTRCGPMQRHRRRQDAYHVFKDRRI